MTDDDDEIEFFMRRNGQVRFLTLKARYILLGLTVSLVFALVSIFFYGPPLSEIVEFSQSPASAPLVAIALAGMLYLLGTSVLAYLNHSRSSSTDHRPVNVSAISKEIQVLKRDLVSLAERQTNLSAKEHSEAKSIIQKQLNQFSIDHIMSRIRADIQEQDSFATAIEPVDKSVTRMISEISSLESRGNLNLTIGIMATIIGIAILAFFVFASDFSGLKFEQLLAQFVPRLSVVLFVQIFAFFFLNLYKSSLSEIKYYHDQITKIESKKAAISIAEKIDGFKSSETILLNLAQEQPKIDQMGKEKATSLEDVAKDLKALSKFLRSFEK